MKAAFKRINTYIDRTGVKGLVSIPIFFFVIWIGITGYIKDGDKILIYFFIGIITAVLLRKIIMNYSHRFYLFAGIFVASTIIIGYAGDIPQFRGIFERYETVLGIVTWFLIGIFFTASFIIYSEPVSAES